MKNKEYKIRAKVWLYPGQTHSNGSGQAGSWHFASIPKKTSEMVKKEHGANARGWGSLPVEVKIGKSTFATSIFPDRKSGEYLLPLKASIRKKEEIFDGDTINFTIEIKT